MFEDIKNKMVEVQNDFSSDYEIKGLCSNVLRIIAEFEYYIKEGEYSDKTHTFMSHYITAITRLEKALKEMKYFIK